MTVAVSIDLDLSQTEAFGQIMARLKESLETKGIEFVPGADGWVKEGDTVVGKFVRWQAPTIVEMEWRTAASWDPKGVTKLKIEFNKIEIGKTRVIVENEGWGGAVGDHALLLLSGLPTK